MLLKQTILQPRNPKNEPHEYEDSVRSGYLDVLDPKSMPANTLITPRPYPIAPLTLPTQTTTGEDDDQHFDMIARWTFAELRKTRVKAPTARLNNPIASLSLRRGCISSAMAILAYVLVHLCYA